MILVRINSSCEWQNWSFRLTCCSTYRDKIIAIHDSYLTQGLNVGFEWISTDIYIYINSHLWLWNKLFANAVFGLVSNRFGLVHWYWQDPRLPGRRKTSWRIAALVVDEVQNFLVQTKLNGSSQPSRLTLRWRRLRHSERFDAIPTGYFVVWTFGTSISVREGVAWSRFVVLRDIFLANLRAKHLLHHRTPTRRCSIWPCRRCFRPEKMLNRYLATSWQLAGTTSWSSQCARENDRVAAVGCG